MSSERETLELDSISQSCARQVVETVPTLMRLIRSGIRNNGGGFSVPQMRVLAFLSRSPGSSVSEVAAYLDVTIPTASALIDRLVRKEWVQRRDDPTERRRVILTLTQDGATLLEQQRKQAQSFVQHFLSVETPEQLSKISEGLALLAEAARTFTPDRKAHLP
jgi:DNA-binding MarR family transcriptional regulator